MSLPDHCTYYFYAIVVSRESTRESTKDEAENENTSRESARDCSTFPY